MSRYINFVRIPNLPLLLLVFLHLAPCFGVEEATKVIEFYNCEMTRVAVSNVHVLPGQILFDDEGNAVDVIKRGSTELLVTTKKVTVGRKGSEEIRRVLRRLNILYEWKNKKPKPSDGIIVGLVVETTDALLFLDDKWWLVRLGGGRIGFIGVDVVIDKNDIKIATIIEEEEIRVTDDSEVVNAFSEFMNTPDE